MVSLPQSATLTAPSSEGAGDSSSRALRRMTEERSFLEMITEHSLYGKIKNADSYFTIRIMFL